LNFIGLTVIKWIRINQIVLWWRFIGWT